MQQSIPGPGLGRGVLGKSAVGALGTRRMLEKVLQMGALVVILRVCVVQNLSSSANLRGRVSVARAVVGSRVSSESQYVSLEQRSTEVVSRQWQEMLVYPFGDSRSLIVQSRARGWWGRSVQCDRCVTVDVGCRYCVYQEFQARPPGLRK